MQIRIKSNSQVVLCSAIVVAMCVAVPTVLLRFFMPPFFPFFVQVPLYTIGILIPLLIAFPLAVFGLYMLKMLNRTVDTLDNFIKFDHLTGLLSRSYFLSSAEQARAAGGHFLMIDADHFKRINDTYGHDGGDEALKAIARLTIQAAGSGLAGRLGGEEFAIYLPGATAEQARQTAIGLGALLRNHMLVLSGRQVTLTASIGIAADPPASTLAQTMKAADTALYAAKSAGRDRYIFAGQENVVQIAAA